MTSACIQVTVEKIPNWVIIPSQHLGFYQFSLGSFSLDRSSCFAPMKTNKIALKGLELNAELLGKALAPLRK